MTNYREWAERFLTAAAVAFGLCSTGASAQTLVPERKSYLQGVPLSYVVPAAPSNTSKVGRKDLVAVKRAQHVGEARRTQAFEDAESYDYDVLLSRFSEAAGTELNLSTRPILAHMLKWLMADAQFYAGAAKYSANPAAGAQGNKRPRPYRRDSSIIPCETDYLYPSDNASYPSGHATNGYVAALLLAEVMAPIPSEPDRRPSIKARGIRYGDNRVVCGVHHPSDVTAGRALAQQVFDRTSGEPEFKADLLCTKRENEASVANRMDFRPPYDEDCQRRFSRYAAEAMAQAAFRRSEPDPFKQR